MANQPAAPFSPSTLLDPRNAADLKQVLWKNFFIINEGPGFSRQPTRVEGTPNTFVGPPDFGIHYVNALWVDGLRALWYCISSGTYGTVDPPQWIQVEVPVITVFPTTTTVGYRVIDSSNGYVQYYWNGTEWIAIGSNIFVSSAANMGTLGADGQGVYDHETGGTLFFRRIKAGENISLVSNANSIEALVKHDPYFIGLTSVDALQVIATTTPATPTEDAIVSWVETTGTSPTQQIVWKAKHKNGSEVILSSVIV